MTEDPTPDAAELIGELVRVTRRLTEVIAAETVVLQSRSVPDPSAFVPEKSKLSVRYEGLLRQLTRIPGATLRAAPGFAELEAAVAGLGPLAQANARAIELHIKATRRVLAIVAQAARQATKPTFSYGGKRLGYGTRGQTNPAVAINRVS